MNENLPKSSIQNYFNSFTKLLEMGNSIDNIRDEPFYTKFFKFPIVK